MKKNNQKLALDTVHNQAAKELIKKRCNVDPYESTYLHHAAAFHHFALGHLSLAHTYQEFALGYEHLDKANTPSQSERAKKTKKWGKEKKPCAKKAK